METQKTFKDEWMEDCKLGTNLQESTENVYVLHNKYMVYLSEIKKDLRLKKSILSSLRLEFSEYYSSVYNTNSVKLDFLKKEPLPRVLPKDKVQSYVDNEPKVQKLSLRIGELEDDIFYLEQIIKSLNTRTYQIKTVLDIMKFESGG